MSKAMDHVPSGNWEPSTLLPALLDFSAHIVHLGDFHLTRGLGSLITVLWLLEAFQ